MRYAVVFREWIGVGYGGSVKDFGAWRGLVILDRETGRVAKGYAPVEQIAHRLNNGADPSAYAWIPDPGVLL